MRLRKNQEMAGDGDCEPALSVGVVGLTRYPEFGCVVSNASRPAAIWAGVTQPRRGWEPFAQPRAAQNTRLRVPYALARIDSAQVLVEQLPSYRPPVSIVARAPQYPADHFDVARNHSCNFTLPPTRHPHVQDDLGMTSGKGDKFG